jgi:hypothetical protein
LNWQFWKKQEPEIVFEPEPHTHAWRPVQSKVVDGESSPTTVVLLRCECGDIATLGLLGRWSYEEVAGKAPDHDEVLREDIKFLRGNKIRP